MYGHAAVGALRLLRALAADAGPEAREDGGIGGESAGDDGLGSIGRLVVIPQIQVSPKSKYRDVLTRVDY